MEKDNTDLEKELDRNLEIYKELEFEQKLEETINKIDKLKEKQKKLKKKTEKKESKTEELIKEQEKLQEDLDKLKEDLKKLEEQNKGFLNIPNIIYFCNLTKLKIVKHNRELNPKFRMD